MPSHQSKGGLLDSSSDGESNEPFGQSLGSSSMRGEGARRNARKFPMGQSSAMLMDKLSTKNSNNSDRPGPFSSKKMVHESDTPHSKDSEGISNFHIHLNNFSAHFNNILFFYYLLLEDPEELVIPGDADELADFSNYSMKNSYVQIKCDLPIVSLQLKYDYFVNKLFEYHMNII